MFNVGGGEMVFLAILALLVFGPEGLPDIVKTVARTVKAFKQAANDFQSEVNTALTLESQKREVEQRRKKRVRPIEQKQPGGGDSDEPEFSSGESQAPLANETAEAEPLEPTTAAAELEAVPPISASQSEASVSESAGQASESAGQACESAGQACESGSETPEVATSASEPEDDDDGPGLPMSRPVRAEMESQSQTQSQSQSQSEPPAADLETVL